jgi:hypothetical protein
MHPDDFDLGTRSVTERRILEGLVPTPDDYRAYTRHVGLDDDSGAPTAWAGEDQSMRRSIVLRWDGTFGVHVEVQGLEHEGIRAIRAPAEIAAIRALIRDGWLEGDVEGGTDDTCWELSAGARAALGLDE